MGGIIYDARRIKAYEYLQELGKMTGKSQDFIDELWMVILQNGDLMEEYMYYIDHHTFLDEIKIEGYGLSDLYMWLIRRFNLMIDYGKNEANCNKEALVLDTFWHMGQMKVHPAEYRKRLEDGFDQGMDQL
ncbi:MAG: hypothetical protein ACI4F4_08715 [Lachnospiraceae bacterium]